MCRTVPCPSVRMEHLDSHCTDFLDILYVHNFSKIYRGSLGFIKIGHVCIHIISLSVLLRMRNVSDKSCRENRNTHFVFNNSPPRKSCRSWDNATFCSAGQAIVANMAHAHCILDITNATNTYSEYIAFTLQQWLYKRS